LFYDNVFKKENIFLRKKLLNKNLNEEEINLLKNEKSASDL
jgi:hypothetical protein